jgi:hypothetical protein
MIEDCANGSFMSWCCWRRVVSSRSGNGSRPDVSLTSIARSRIGAVCSGLHCQIIDTGTFDSDPYSTTRRKVLARM